jgi:hypothetical protein
MEEKELEKAEADLKKAEADLKVAKAAEEAAEHKIDEAIEEIKEAEAHHHETHFEIKIDRTTYKVELKDMTGLQLRELPSPPLGPDRDLFEVVPGGTDAKIGDAEVVEIRNGLRFFSAPAQINPGAERSTLRA